MVYQTRRGRTRKRCVLRRIASESALDDLWACSRCVSNGPVPSGFRIALALVRGEGVAMVMAFDVQTARRQDRAGLASASPLVLSAVLALAGVAGAQGPEPDADLAALTPVIVAPNSGSDYIVVGVVTLNPGHYEIRANLILGHGSELRIRGAMVDIVGNVELREGGHLSAVDSTVRQVNSYPRQFGYTWTGGHLYTERCVIGGIKTGYLVNFSAFWLHRGLWEAVDTTVQYSAGILPGVARRGFNGNAAWKGGTLIARRLFQGEAPDFVYGSSLGDVMLSDSTFNLSIGVYADGPAPVQATFDMSSRNPIVHDVYGDPANHAGVTRPIANSTWRLQLDNVRVPFWHLVANDMSNSGRPLTLTMDNAENVLCAFSGRDLTGSPTLGGDWSRYQGQLPGLPSAAPPGWHAMPPGASVSLGNATFRAGATDALVRQWGIYLIGPSSNVSVTGTSAIAEIVLEDARLSLQGGKDFDMGLLAATIDLHGTSVLTANNVSIGQFGAVHGLYGKIEAVGRATCTLTNVRVADCALITGIETKPNSSQGLAQGRITVQNVYPEGQLDQIPYPPGSITVARASVTQNTDRQNLGFEGGIQASGSPDYWSVQSIAAGSLVTGRPSPCPSGTRSYRYQTSGSAGRLFKSLTLPEGTHVTLLGHARIQSLAGGQSLGFGLSAPGSTSRQGLLGTGLTTWQLVSVPDLILGPGNAVPVEAAFFNTPAGNADVLLDDVRVHISNWWDNNNLANLDFEDTRYRDGGGYPEYWRAPDYWHVSRGIAVAESADRRPGSPGQRSVRVTQLGDITTDLYKDWTFLLPGDVVTVQGWVKGIPIGTTSCWIQLQLGEGFSWNDRGYGNNQWAIFPSDRQWRQFSLTYTVPCPPIKQAFTRFNVDCFRGDGNVLLVDDITVTIR
jgi:hypothetical protein